MSLASLLRGSFCLLVSAFETRCLTLFPLTRQMTCASVSSDLRRWRICVPRVPVAPVNSTTFRLVPFSYLSPFERFEKTENWLTKPSISGSALEGDGKNPVFPFSLHCVISFESLDLLAWGHLRMAQSLGYPVLLD